MRHESVLFGLYFVFVILHILCKRDVYLQGANLSVNVCKIINSAFYYICIIFINQCRRIWGGGNSRTVIRIPVEAKIFPPAKI
jgi:hypothetical protein